jgi:hypothetical protein
MMLERELLLTIILILVLGQIIIGTAGILFLLFKLNAIKLAVDGRMDALLAAVGEKRYSEGHMRGVTDEQSRRSDVLRNKPSRVDK